VWLNGTGTVRTEGKVALVFCRRIFGVNREVHEVLCNITRRVLAIYSDVSGSLFLTIEGGSKLQTTTP
jgi:hypothetical protein